MNTGYALSLLWGMCTSLANPILYSLLNEGFRAAVREKAAKCACTRALGRAYSTRRNSR